MRQRARTSFALLVVFLGWSCSLVVDSKDVAEGCPEDQKACDGSCVPLDDPLFGCARAACSPCALERATASCDAEGECTVGACAETWADCDGESANGCEVNTDSSVKHCGGCSLPCTEPADGRAACGNGACYITECTEGFADCNGDFQDGCEIDLSTGPAHCEACDQECARACELGDDDCD